MNAVVDIKVPNGLTLDVSRVGQVVPYPDNVHVGETVSFYYTHGSYDGQRTVLVLFVDGDYLEGLTLERDGEYRRYNEAYISGNISIVRPFVTSPVVSIGNVKRVRFDQAIEALAASLSGEQLAQLYSQYVALEGDGAEFDATSGEVVVKLPESKVNKFTLISMPGEIQIVNKKNETFKLFGYKYDQTVGYSGPNCNSINCTPEQLRDELVKFLA